MKKSDMHLMLPNGRKEKVVSFLWQHLCLCCHLTRHSVVDDLVVDCALSVAGSRRTEFYFYCSHV